MIERLQHDDLGPDVGVEDLYYGAVAVAQRLQECRPGTLILVGTHERDRDPGTIERRFVDPRPPDEETVQRSVVDAVVGYVDLEIALDVLAGFGALPRRTIVFEVEPAATEPSEVLSAEAASALERVIELIRAEVWRAPLFDLREGLLGTVSQGRLERSPALVVLIELLDELGRAEVTGRWGMTFTLRDRLRALIAEGMTGEGMDHLDWGLWWALIEELDRIQGSEAASI